VNLPKRPGYENCKTVVFDLDETLVHCIEDITQPHDIALPIVFPTGEIVTAGICLRPFVH